MYIDVICPRMQVIEGVSYDSVIAMQDFYCGLWECKFLHGKVWEEYNKDLSR